MNVVKCKNDHFFDVDAYQVCPLCGAAAGAGGTGFSGNPDRSKKKKKKLFGGGKNPDVNADNAEPEEEKLTTLELPAESSSGSSPAPAAEQEERTRALQEMVQSVSANTEGKTASFYEDTKRGVRGVQSRSVAPAPPDSSDTEKTVALFAAPEVPDTSDTEKTVALFATPEMPDTSDTEKTVALFAAPEAQEAPDPVVGWLVGVSGKHFGESFQIGAGQNSIGRGAENRIVLDKDPGVSPGKHALIIYEPKKRIFYLQPGDSRGLTYLNGDYISEARQLSARDTIELGSGKYLFVPLCDETFSWENYM